MANKKNRYTEGEVFNPEQDRVNSVIMEIACDLSEQLTITECLKKGIKCVVEDDDVESYTEEAQDIFNDHYDAKMAEVYTLANKIDGRVTYDKLVAATKKLKNR